MSDDYAILRDYGHTPYKAAEIVLDAARGDGWAAKWIAYVRSEQLAARTQTGAA